MKKKLHPYIREYWEIQKLFDHPDLDGEMWWQPFEQAEDNIEAPIEFFWDIIGVVCDELKKERNR